MLPYRDSRLTKIALGVFFLAVIGYAYFEVRGLLFGPRISVASNVSTVHEQYVLITGRAERIASLSIDGAPVPVTTDGAFEIPRLLAPGLNKITLDARDSYNHTTSQTIEIVYVPSAASSTSASTEATDTEPSTSTASDMSDSTHSPEATSTAPAQ